MNSDEAKPVIQYVGEPKLSADLQQITVTLRGGEAVLTKSYIFFDRLKGIFETDDGIYIPEGFNFAH